MILLAFCFGAVTTVDDDERRVLLILDVFWLMLVPQNSRQLYRKLDKDHRFVNTQQQQESMMY